LGFFDGGGCGLLGRELHAVALEHASEEGEAVVGVVVPLVVVELGAAGWIWTRLRVEEGVDEGHFSLCNRFGYRLLHLAAGHKEGSKSLGVVGDDGLVGVVLEGAGSVGLAS